MYSPARFIFASLLAFCAVSSAAPKNSLEYRASADGWYNRTQLHPAGSSYQVDETKLVSGVIRSTRGDPEHLTAAFFKPDVVVDAMGRVLTVNKSDFDALTKLASEITALPPTGQFRNLWSVKQAHTDWPIHYISVGRSGAQHVVGVYGHDGTTTRLDPPVGRFRNLPRSLNSFLTLAKEADESYDVGTANTAMINQVKAVIHLD